MGHQRAACSTCKEWFYILKWLENVEKSYFMEHEDYTKSELITTYKNYEQMITCLLIIYECFCTSDGSIE